jgi:hypothetical protein
VLERLAGHPRREVGDQREPKHLGPGLAGSDRLQCRRHADEVSPDGPHHGDLRRGLIVRPGKLGVDPLLEPRVDLAAQGPQPWRVQVGEVHEPRPDDGGGAREVEVVADQDRCAGSPLPAQAAAAVGQHDDSGAGVDRGADAVHDRGHPPALVEVGPPQEHQGAASSHLDRADPPGVTGHRRRRETGQIGHGQVVLGGSQRLGCRHPTRAHDQRDVVVRPASERPQALASGARGRVRVDGLPGYGLACHTREASR